MQHLRVQGETHMKSLSLSEGELRIFQREALRLGLEDSDLITQLVRRYLKRKKL